MLRQYNLAVPDGAERIMRMAEEEGVSRRDLDRFESEQSARADWRGLNYAFILALVFAAVALVAMLKGSSLVGLGIVIAEITTLAGAFFLRPQPKDHSRSKRGKPRTHQGEHEGDRAPEKS